MRKFCVALGLAMMVLVPCASSAQSERYWERTTIPVDWYLTATDYPCLVETVHVTGTYQETFHAVFTPSGSYSAVLTQTRMNFLAVGLTSGATYQLNGPLVIKEGGYTDEPWVTWFLRIWTFHNIINLEGPGDLQNLYVRTSTHVTLDPATGEVKVWVEKDKLVCK